MLTIKNISTQLQSHYRTYSILPIYLRIWKLIEVDKNPEHVKKPWYNN